MTTRGGAETEGHTEVLTDESAAKIESITSDSNFGWSKNGVSNSGISHVEPQVFFQPTPLSDVAEPTRHWPEQPVRDAFYGLAGAFVDIVSPHTEADPVALLVQFLVFFGNAAGRSSYFRVEADYHTANINAILVGDTA